MDLLMVILLGLITLIICAALLSWQINVLNKNLLHAVSQILVNQAQLGVNQKALNDTLEKDSEALHKFFDSIVLEPMEGQVEFEADFDSDDDDDGGVH